MYYSDVFTKSLKPLQKHRQNVYFHRSDMIYTFCIFFEIQFTVLRLSVKYDLDEFLRKSRSTLNLDVVLEVAIDLIYAIQCMEQKGVVHNNITTANVLIARGLRVIFICYNMLTCFARRIKNGVVSFNV